MSYAMLKDVLGRDLCLNMFMHIQNILSKCKNISRDYYLVCSSGRFNSLFRDVIKASFSDYISDVDISRYANMIQEDVSAICNKKCPTEDDVKDLFLRHYLYITEQSRSIDVIINSYNTNKQIPNIIIIDDVLNYGSIINNFLFNLELEFSDFEESDSICNYISIIVYAISNKVDILLRRYKKDVSYTISISDIDINNILMRINQCSSVSIFGSSFTHICALCNKYPEYLYGFRCIVTRFQNTEQRTFVIYSKHINFLATISFRNCGEFYASVPIVLSCDYELFYNSITNLYGHNIIKNNEYDINNVIYYAIIKYSCSNEFTIYSDEIPKNGEIDLFDIIKECYHIINCDSKLNFAEYSKCEYVNEDSDMQFSVEDCISDIGLKFYRDADLKRSTSSIFSDFDICKFVRNYNIYNLFDAAYEMCLTYRINNNRLNIYNISAIISQFILFGIMQQVFIYGDDNYTSNESVIYIPSYLSIYILPIRYKFFLYELITINNRFKDNDVFIRREIEEISNKIDYNDEPEDWHCRPSMRIEDMNRGLNYFYNSFMTSGIDLRNFNFPLIDYSSKYKKVL